MRGAVWSAACAGTANALKEGRGTLKAPHPEPVEGYTTNGDRIFVKIGSSF